MKQKIFIDSDVILDVLLHRDPFFIDSQRVFSQIELNKVEGFTSSLILANCHYIFENLKNKQKADNAIQKLRSILTILPFADKEIGESLASPFKDFEDGIQHFIATNSNIRVLITRNIKDFSTSGLTVMTPKDFIEWAQKSSRGNFRGEK